MLIYNSREVFQYLYMNKYVDVLLINGHKFSVKQDEQAIKICCKTFLPIVNNNVLHT